MTAARRDRGRKLTRGEILARHALLEDGEPVRCSCTSQRKVTYPSFRAARAAASELVQSDFKLDELHLHPCRVDNTRWHHTSKAPCGPDPDAPVHVEGRTLPPRRLWTVTAAGRNPARRMTYQMGDVWPQHLQPKGEPDG